MKLIQLEYLISVASEGSFTRAAAKLGVAQSAVSHQVSKLEDELGVLLLERGRPTINTTDAGALFVSRVSRGLTELAAAREEIMSLRGQTVGEVRVGATTPTASLDIPEMLARFRVLAPAVRVTLREGTTHELIELLRQDLLDVVVIAAEPSALPPGIRGTVVDHEDLVLVGRTGHHLEALAPVDVTELQGEEMVTFRRGAGLRTVIDNVLAHHGVTPRVMIESNEMPVLMGLVRTAHGVAVVPRQYVVDYPRDVWAREITPHIRPPVLLAWRHGRRYPPAAETFLKFVLHDTQPVRSGEEF